MRVCDKDSPVRRDRQTRWCVQFGRGGRGTVPSKALHAIPCYRRDNCAHAAHPMIGTVAHQQRSRRVKRQGRGRTQAGLRWWSTISFEPRAARARKGGDHARADGPHPGVPGIGDVQRAVRTEGQPLWLVQFGRRRRSTVAAEALHPRPRDDDQRTGEGRLQDLVPLYVGKKKIAVTVIGNGCRLEQRRRAGLRSSALPRHQHSYKQRRRP